ncbi:L-ribulose-5-phosphate 4-epimerase ulaF [Escherichia coli]|uniref:L-ribulose-5-phosphate 4-epimerase ulaF n=1 Tax=Escherichia coli TaxID=562 RepID=A0A2X1JAC0_ECOLX|nr:L-ribulose-5-phosphate 4-epimerase ulaF [Escherichia coli]
MWSETAEDPAAEVAKARDWVESAHGESGHGWRRHNAKAKNSRCLKPTWILPRYGLVTFTWGNVSAIDRERGAGGDQAQRRCLRNHESGRYVVVVDMSGKVVEGEYRPIFRHCDASRTLPVVTRRLAALSIPTPLMPPQWAQRGWRSRR